MCFDVDKCIFRLLVYFPLVSSDCWILNIKPKTKRNIGGKLLVVFCKVFSILEFEKGNKKRNAKKENFYFVSMKKEEVSKKIVFHIYTTQTSRS